MEIFFSINDIKINQPRGVKSLILSVWSLCSIRVVTYPIGFSYVLLKFQYTTIIQKKLQNKSKTKTEKAMGCEKKGAEWETISTTPKVQNNEASRYLIFFNETVLQGLQNSCLKTSWRTGIKLFVSSQSSLVDLVKLLSLKVRFWLKKTKLLADG